MKPETHDDETWMVEVKTFSDTRKLLFSIGTSLRLS